MSAVCPSCGVAVVPGYVKCPKCQTQLPQRRAVTQAAGGTAVDGGGPPIAMILLGVAAIGVVIAVFALRGGQTKAAPGTAPVSATEPDDPDPTPSEPDVTPTPTPTQPAVADPTTAIRDLERELKKERLWGTVEAVGGALEIRSAGCREATMMPILDAAVPALKDGGLSKVRCLEQGGAVVFERDL
jgi:hypothetical protein